MSGIWGIYGALAGWTGLHAGSCHALFIQSSCLRPAMALSAVRQHVRFSMAWEDVVDDTLPLRNTRNQRASRRTTCWKPDFYSGHLVNSFLTPHGIYSEFSES